MGDEEMAQQRLAANARTTDEWTTRAAHALYASTCRPAGPRRAHMRDEWVGQHRPSQQGTVCTAGHEETAPSDD